MNYIPIIYELYLNYHKQWYRVSIGRISDTPLVNPHTENCFPSRVLNQY